MKRYEEEQHTREMRTNNLPNEQSSQDQKWCQAPKLLRNFPHFLNTVFYNNSGRQTLHTSFFFIWRISVLDWWDAVFPSWADVNKACLTLYVNAIPNHGKGIKEKGTLYDVLNCSHYTFPTLNFSGKETLHRTSRRSLLNYTYGWYEFVKTNPFTCFVFLSLFSGE